jgi:lipopolysaccharide/colanic/teichoic acid biosynthesis glycosyltransferase
MTSKRVCDVMIASIIFCLAVPIILTCSLLIRLTSRGPALYSQTRLGRFGQPFRIWKLRSMTHDCEKASGARWATRQDPRVTPIGKFLRITHLDELPQLWNVLRGDMSLVGPRPERPEFIPILESVLPHYRRRMSVRPGVTGLAQVYLPPDTGIPSVRKKLQYDLYYIQRISAWMDLRLMMATALQAIGFPSEPVRWIFMLPAIQSIETPFDMITPLGPDITPARERIDPVIAREAQQEATA